MTNARKALRAGALESNIVPSSDIVFDKTPLDQAALRAAKQATSK